MIAYYEEGARYFHIGYESGDKELFSMMLHD